MSATLFDIFIQAAKSPYSIKSTKAVSINTSIGDVLSNTYEHQKLFSLDFHYYNNPVSISLHEDALMLYGLGEEMKLTNSQKEDCLEAWYNKSHDLNSVLEYLKQ